MSDFQKRNPKITTAPQQLDGKPFFQPKLSINQPNDIYEQEADAMADSVMRKETESYQNIFFKSTTSTNTEINPKTTENTIQKKENIDTEQSSNPGLENYVEGLSSTGNKLSNQERNFFEPKFGYDFSDVKIHTDNKASESANSINALAYTTGNNIVFNKGAYSPETDNGKKLIAHELTHVVQQNTSVKRKIIQKADDPAAVEKDPQPAEVVVENRPPRPSDPATQMANLLATAKKNAKGMVGKCYSQFKANVLEAGGYGDILNIHLDSRFDGFRIPAVDFAKAIEKNGAANMGLEVVSGLPENAPAGTILVIKGNGEIRLSETYGDISVIEGVVGSNIICYNDGRMILETGEEKWNNGRYKNVLVAMYKPIARQ